MQTRIREVRKARGLTLADVAARCQPETTAQTIGRLETGLRTVSVGWLNRIALALEVEPSALVTLPERADVPVAALLGIDGAEAPRKPMTIVLPQIRPGALGLVVRSSVGDWRAGDQAVLESLGPRAYASALNRDALVPLPAGRFLFGRVVAVSAKGVTVLAPQAGAAARLVPKPAWIAVARILIRLLDHELRL